MSNLAMVCNDCLGDREMETKTLGYMKETFTCDICKRELNTREKLYGFITWAQWYDLIEDLLINENTDILVTLSILNYRATKAPWAADEISMKTDDAQFCAAARNAMPELLRLAYIGREGELVKEEIKAAETRRLEREAKLEKLGFEMPTKEELELFKRGII